MRKLKEDKEIPGMKWFKGGSVYKPYFLSGQGVDAVAVDSYVDKLVKEHNNRFEIKDPRITEELYFEIQYWETGDGDNVYVDILFNREFDREMNADKWGEKSYGATNEHGYVEDLLNNGGLEKLGITDAKITGTGWDSSKHVPRWSIELFTFSDRNIDGTFKRPNTSDAWTSSHNVNGTEPFNKEEGKEINKAVTDYIIELLRANPARVYYEPSKGVTEVNITDSKTRSYDPSWKGSYTHNTGWFNFTCYIEDAYDENAIDWRGRQGDTFRADEDVITALLRDKAAETLNDFLYEFNLEVVPDGCKAEWYHGSEAEDECGHWFDVSIKFKEIGIDPDKSYYAHKGNSFKDYWPGSEPEDLYKGKTFKRNPKKIKEGLFDNVEFGTELSTPPMEKYKDVIVSSIDEGIANRETPKETIENTIYEVLRMYPEDNINGEILRDYVCKKVYERNPYEEEADEYLKESKNLKENYVTDEQREAALAKARAIHNALVDAGLQDIDMQLESFISNQPNEKAWYYTLVDGTAENFVDERTDEDWRQYLTESKSLKEGVILHFDLEDGTHKALPFDSEEEALEYMDSDDFPIGEWVGSYDIETVKETKPVNGDDYNYQVLKPEDIEKLNDLVKEIKDGNEDGWCDWIDLAIEIGRKYLGKSLSRYGEGEYTPFEDLINECETFVYYKTPGIDKMLKKRLDFQNEESVEEK